MRFRLGLITMLAGGLNAPLLAHHSLAAEYDQARVSTIKGTISTIVWRNPHASITLAVKNPDGSTNSTKIEIAPPGALTRKGFVQTDLTIGDSVTVEAWMPKDLRNTSSAAGRTLTLGDGRQVDVADSWMWQPLNVPAGPPAR